jgi:hypothetical protein
MTGGNVRMQIVLNAELHSFLKERCAAMGVSMNTIVNWLVRKEMERIDEAAHKARMNGKV